MVTSLLPQRGVVLLVFVIVYGVIAVGIAKYGDEEMSEIQQFMDDREWRF